MPPPGCTGVLNGLGVDYCYDPAHVGKSFVLDPLSGCDSNFVKNDQGLSWWWPSAVQNPGGLDHHNNSCVDSYGRTYKRYVFSSGKEMSQGDCAKLCARHEECRGIQHRSLKDQYYVIGHCHILVDRHVNVNALSSMASGIHGAQKGTNVGPILCYSTVGSLMV